MTNAASPFSNPATGSMLPGAQVDGAGVTPASPGTATPDLAALLAGSGRPHSRPRYPLRRADPRFCANSSSPEMQRMALVAALSVLIAGCSMLPEGRGVSRAPTPQIARPAALPAPSVADTRQCISALTQAQVRFTPVPDQVFGAGCSQLGSVRLSTIALTDAPRGLNELAISNIGPVRCELAQRFAGWAQFGIARAAEQMLGSPLVKIETMGSYSCRNIAGSVKLSQHAHANAIDIAAFVLADGRRISVKQGWAGSNQERAFLRTIHASACKRFGTVLGPDYNAAHQDHLHVDMSGQGYCR
ncbi:extensin family protein [Blastomonas sp.]|jgi:hypothetical protein|uniref:extensin family protein n=1 Tax=Blastomonas TaxID=150203 RepID=UPI00338D9FDB